MKDRLLKFLKTENKTSAQMAEEIGVQPSGISHILSGRNNPSLDFIVKMLDKYKFLSTDWLVLGKGSMYKDIKMQTLFGENNGINQDNDAKPVKNEFLKPETEFRDLSKAEIAMDSSVPSRERPKTVEKIVWFYDNNSFEEYFPNR